MSEDKDIAGIDELPPLDDFERVWTGQLSEPDAEWSRSAEVFVQGVLDRRDADAQRPAIVGRLGFGAASFAAAAAVLIAAVIGWYVVTGNGPATDGTAQIAENDEPDPPSGTHHAGQNDEDAGPPQPDAGPRVVPVDPAKIQLGRMIAQTQSTVTKPASNLTQTVTQTPQALTMDKLLDLIKSPVPDLSEILAPLKPADDQQSRA
ncbi:MAG: hypothetical protein ACE37H_02480 [Phycisphaeraceae bacterium]